MTDLFQNVLSELSSFWNESLPYLARFGTQSVIVNVKMDESEFEEFNCAVKIVESGRKRRKNEEKWKKTVEKRVRYSMPNVLPQITCTHLKPTAMCLAREKLTTEDLTSFREKLYSHKTKVEQDAFLLKYMITQETKSHRPRTATPRTRSRTDYFIRKVSGQLVRVCAKMFMSITNIKRRRLNGISNHFMKHGTNRSEKRGGPRISYKHQEITESIKQHIMSFRCRESHYGRGKSVRSYLPPELSTKKMYRMWKAQRNQDYLPVCCFSKYYNIFSNNFNLGFGNPRTDICSFCELKKIEIRKCTDLKQKQELITIYRLHKLRAKKFYQILRNPNYDDEEVVKICFDMQQNQPLPKLSIGEVYYARQIWIYNFTVVIIEPNQNKNNTFIYSWTELDGPRGSNEIVSCVIHFLKILEEKLASGGGHKKLMIFSDACAAQNKNSAMIGALLHFIQNSQVFNSIEHIFPIRGHSYMPPDRIFGRIEKQFRKKESILSPDEYYNIYEEHGTLFKYGQDFEIKNYKQAAKNIFKAKFPFKMQDARIFKFVKGKYYGGTKTTYTGEYLTNTVLKRNIVPNRFYNNIESIPAENCISEEKKNDVRKLLQFCDVPAAAKAFYDQALESCTSAVPNQETVYGNDDEEPFI